MSRPRGSKNKEAVDVPETILFNTGERVEFLANIIVDFIINDQGSGQQFLKQIGVSRGNGNI